MEWQKDYNTGIVVIDTQHKKLNTMISNIEYAVDTEYINQILGNVLKELVEYVKYHFEEEEKVMQEVHYPDIKHHKKLHNDLINQVVKILIDMKKGKVINANEIKLFLQKWLVDHILLEDKKIGNYFP